MNLHVWFFAEVTNSIQGDPKTPLSKRPKLSEEEWKTHNNANVKLDFIIQNLSNLSKDLKKLNIPLIAASIKNF